MGLELSECLMTAADQTRKRLTERGKQQQRVKGTRYSRARVLQHRQGGPARERKAQEGKHRLSGTRGPLKGALRFGYTCVR